MIKTKIIRTALCLCIFIPIFSISHLSVAAVDSSLVLQQTVRSSALTVAGLPREEMVIQLMVKPRFQAGDQLKASLEAHDASGLARLSKVPMSVVRPMSGDAHVIRFDHPVTLSEARVIAARLMQDSSVELAEPDRLKRPMTLTPVTPTDPDYAAYQWNLFAPSSANLGSANLPGAWGITKGNNTVTVAVIDTGYRPHQDFGFSYSGSVNSTPVILSAGYTFITDIPTANNGVGREADALDPGDWITGAENTNFSGAFYGCGALGGRSGTTPLNQLSPSSWHGTHVSGILAAQMNNGIGIAGIAPNVQILPVRVLGKCGGYDSDIIDGMRWAAGLSVTGVPANQHPAQVLSMSLGGSGGTPCPSSYQSAVTEIINAGKTIVVAAGNDGTSTLSTPANCSGVIAVTANSIDGDNAYYATIGPGTTISAPGGDCGGTNPNCISANYPGVYSTVNSGTTNPVASPGGDVYAAYSGTSMATPHVSAVAALMLSVNPSLTPAQITSYLQSTSRPFPANTICTQTGNSGLCGTGLLDAYQALNAVQSPSASSPPVVTLSNIPPVVVPGAIVNLTGNAVAGSGANILSYLWTQQTGPSTVTLSNANTANASFTTSTPGSYSFVLTATDNNGQSGSANVVIVVNSPPVLNALPTQTTSVGLALTFTVSATDANMNSLVYHSASLPSGATLSATGTFSWPNPTPAGNYTLTYYASDNYSSSPQGTVNITVTSGGTGSTVTANLTTGWNLVGNGVEAQITVAGTFNDKTKVSTVWKWVTSGTTKGITYPAWAFYTPSQSDGGQAYASSKGYDFLITINAGEGFWVNALTSVALPLPTGALVQSNSFQPSSGTHALPSGWSLIASGDSLTPAGINVQLSSTPPTAGSIPTNLTTLWAWNATSAGWYFWAPSLINNGTLGSYLSSKGYLDFNTLPGTPAGTISPTTGFWVNMP